MKKFHLSRAVYALVFFSALLAVFAGWPMVGGQAHLDYIAWEWKLAGSFAFAATATMAARSAVEGENAWNASATGWLLTLLLVIAGMGLLTYQAHLEEQQSEESEMFRGSVEAPCPPLRPGPPHVTLEPRNLPRRPAYL
ncbi:MAG: hypothetical protein SFV51_05435 [Bryobacteraceae bacterium]|nr:hypothetical protein [Bryobacteraceae bacterium]